MRGKARLPECQIAGQPEGKGALLTLLVQTPLLPSREERGLGVRRGFFTHPSPLAKPRTSPGERERWGINALLTLALSSRDGSRGVLTRRGEEGLSYYISMEAK